MKFRLPTIWRKPRPKVSADLSERPYPFAHQLEPTHTVLPAFNLNGTQYYRFAQTDNMPLGRMLDCLAAMSEHDMGIDRQQLIAYLDGVHAALNPKGTDQRIALGDASLLIKELRERLDYAFDTDLVIRMASIVFFTADENPYKADKELSLRKEALFREECRTDGPLRFFFTTLGLHQYLPLLEQHGMDIPTYTHALRSEKLRALANLQAAIYSHSEMRPTVASLVRERATLQKLTSSSAPDGGTTTFSASTDTSS
jgi:hypothetical protein